MVDVTQVFEIYSDVTRELSKLGAEVPNDQQVALLEEQGALVLAEIEELCQEKGIPITMDMIFGGIPETILKTSKNYNLFAIGRRMNHYEKNTKQLGGNFQQIAHHIRTLLLVSGSVTTYQKFQRVILACDRGEASRQALTWAENLKECSQKLKNFSRKDLSHSEG